MSDFINDIKTLKWLHKNFYEVANTKLCEVEIKMLRGLEEKYNPMDVIQMLLDAHDKLLAERDKLREGIAEMQGRLNSMDTNYAVAIEERDKLLAENAELKKERTAYRTLNAIVGDNAEKCELYDDIEALEAKLKIAEARIKELENDKP